MSHEFSLFFYHSFNLTSKSRFLEYFDNLTSIKHKFIILQISKNNNYKFINQKNL
jgi:hypothetical protein